MLQIILQLVFELYTMNPMFKFGLRSKPTQFTRGKTEDTLCDLTQRYLLNCLNHDEHLIDIVVTNKSLAETDQWKTRTTIKFQNEPDERFANIQIDILSSKKTSDFRNINDYITNILTCTNKADLPNILIVCYHSKRVCEDLIQLIRAFSGETFVRITSPFKFHINFDEPDANLGVTTKFLKKVKPYIETGRINGILFITATPVAEFWKMLATHGITTLLNLNSEYMDNFDNELEEYRSFKDHDIVLLDNDTTNPLDYIHEVFERGLIDENTRQILFAPAHITREPGCGTQLVGSHREVTDYFLQKGYCVLLMNGTFKGFQYPDGSAITLDEFKQQNRIEGELRDSLRIWNMLHPNMNLAITGYWVIERGITFNTNGFGFTSLILSNYHLKALNRLIQIAGRATGGKRYVKIMKIVCTREVRNAVFEFNENLEAICRMNPGEFNQTDFVSCDKTIPVKVIFNDEEQLQLILAICDKKRPRYKQQIHQLLCEGIDAGTIQTIDKNNVKKFNIHVKNLKDVRMYKLGDSIESRRYKQFNEAHVMCNTVAQSGDENQYNIDLVRDTYITDGYVNEPNVAWITFKWPL